ncbi:MAG: hypothetical protein DRQ01_08740 [Ignavibacteriae bacterium]|nr:MAG: hypothetical protein DRQ01_08740 [Ignavibacteriota bacterium]
MKISIKYLAFILVVILLAACSKLNDELVPAPEVNIHGEGVYNPSSPDFHGKLVVDSQNGIEDCRECHAADYSGGLTNVSCNSLNCHPTINVHVEGIIDPSSNDFHGSFIKGIL